MASLRLPPLITVPINDDKSILPSQQRLVVRAATHSQNCMNRRVRFDSRSGIKGVNLRKGKWHTCVILNNEKYSAGTFDHKEDAMAAVDKLRKELHGEFARS